jgi:hypothetical protein
MDQVSTRRERRSVEDEAAFLFRVDHVVEEQTDSSPLVTGAD